MLFEFAAEFLGVLQEESPVTEDSAEVLCLEMYEDQGIWNHVRNLLEEKIIEEGGAIPVIVPEEAVLSYLEDYSSSFLQWYLNGDVIEVLIEYTDTTLSVINYVHKPNLEC